MTGKTVAIVQARMGSTRLPGKVLEDLGGVAILQWVIERLSRAECLDAVVVATTTATADDAITALCHQLHVPVFRGSEHDVLDRFRSAALEHAANTVVRVTADCPFIDPDLVDEVVRVLHRGGDYCSNINPPTFPDGLDVEAITRDALEEAWDKATLPSDREHVTPYVRARPDRFVIHNVVGDRDLSGLRCTVDEPEDLEFARAVAAATNGREFGWDELVRLLLARPDLTRINAAFQRNEGYARSLDNDRLRVNQAFE